MMSAYTSEKPQVSVLMTVFNPDSVFFPQAVDSILRQTFEDFEFIIVEDPSPRLARDMLSDDQLSRARYFRNTRRTSLIEQKNRGIHECVGKYIAMMDSDDVAHPDRLNRQVEFLEANTDVDVVGCQIAVIDEDSDLRGYRSFPTEHRDIVHSLSRTVPFCHPSVTVRRCRLTEVGGYRDFGFQTSEDYELWSRMFFAGAKFANLPEILLYYRVHQNQLKMTHMRDTIRAVLHVKETCWRRHMDVRACGRMMAERCLACLPEGTVYKLALQMLYNDEPPAVAVNRNDMAQPFGSFRCELPIHTVFRASRGKDEMAPP